MKRRSLGCALELLETLLLALIVFMVVQMFVAQPYQVQQESMENTLMPDQYVLVDKLSPLFDDYNQGDIVVFTPPEGWSHDKANTPFIKRVIGLPGDKIDIHDGKVFVNDTAARRAVRLRAPDHRPCRMPRSTPGRSARTSCS